VATGDQTDIQTRLQRLVPTGWFQNGLVPVRDALLLGLAWAHAFAFALLAYVRLQTRIATASDGFLDMIAGDYFGTAVLRATGQTDASFRSRITAELVRERATRNALVQVLTQITGIPPVVIEPQRPQDCGGYGAPNCGYSVAGYYGSVVSPMHVFLIAYRAPGQGVPLVAGYGTPAGGYGVGLIEYASLSMVSNSVTDADIYAAVDRVKPVTSIIWTTIKAAPPAAFGHIGIDFVVGSSPLL